MLEAFNEIKSVKVHRAALWILGEYATSVTDIEAVMKQLHRTLGEGPLLETEQKLVAGEITTEGGNTSTNQTSSTLVTSDGTYATQSAFNTVQ